MTSPLTKKYKVEGMHCVSCAMLIESELEDANLVDEATCVYATSELSVKAHKAIDDTQISAVVEKLGYKATAIPC
jgi:copper chaperone CopZ